MRQYKELQHLALVNDPPRNIPTASHRIIADDIYRHGIPSSLFYKANVLHCKDLPHMPIVSAPPREYSEPLQPHNR